MLAKPVEIHKWKHGQIVIPTGTPTIAVGVLVVCTPDHRRLLRDPMFWIRCRLIWKHTADDASLLLLVFAGVVYKNLPPFTTMACWFQHHACSYTLTLHIQADRGCYIRPYCIFKNYLFVVFIGSENVLALFLARLAGLVKQFTHVIQYGPAMGLQSSPHFRQRFHSCCSNKPWSPFTSSLVA